MKKIAVLFVLFLCLTMGVWGQAEFTWNGSVDTNWETTGNWTVVNANGIPSPDYPGANSRVNDIVIIQNDIWSPGVILSTGSITIKNLTIGSGLQVYIDTNSNVLTVTNQTILNGVLFVLPPGDSSTSQINITNLFVGSGNVVGVADTPASSNVRMNGALVTMNPYFTDGPITLDPVTGNIGNISGGNRPVVINIQNGVGPVEIGNIDSVKNITINIGTGNNVDIGDIFSGGNVTINNGAGSNVTISDIDAVGIINGIGGDVVVGGVANTFHWITTATSSNWTDGTNWEEGSSPGNGNGSEKIYINESTNYPIFSGGTELICDTLIIHLDASLDMGTSKLNATTFTNNGTLILAGASGQSVTGVVNAGNVTYNATAPADGINLAGLTSFKDLKIQNGTRTVSGAITVSGTLTISASASLDMGASNLTVNTLTNDGTLILAGASGQSVTGVTNAGNVKYNATVPANGIDLAGLTSFKDLTIQNGTRTVSGAIAVSGTLTIDTSASLDIGTNNLAVTTAFTNNGTLKLEGVSGQTVSGTGVTNAGDVIYNATVPANGINLAGLTSFKDLTIQNGNRTGVGAITVGVDFKLENDTLNATSIDVTGTSLIGGNITTSGAQTYTGLVTLDGSGASYTLNAGTGMVTFGNSITGGNNSLSITASAATFNGGSGIDVLYVNGNFNLASGPLSMESINVNGTSFIAGNVTTNGADPAVPNYAQFYNGAVTLGNDVNFTGVSGSTVYFSGAVNGDATPAKKITITNADVVFNSTVGNLPTSNIESVTVNIGTTIINADITTTGNQSYGSGTVTTTGTITLTSTGGNITTGGTLTGSNITINAGGVVAIGTLSVTSNTEINAGGNISLSNIIGGVFTLNAGYPNHEDFGTSGTITLTDINVTDLTIWCEIIASSGGTKSVTNIELNTDSLTTGGTFLSLVTIGGTQSNNERQHPLIIDIKILYSFTEDVNKNGKIDRIRVQTDKNLTPYISHLSVTVDNNSYEINGLALVNLTSDNDSFYIYLKEKSEYDGNITPSLDISLSGVNARIDPTSNIEYIDTIPPRIVYTLTLPGRSETYVQMSEPVKDSLLNGDISDGNTSFGSVTGVNYVAPFGYHFVHSDLYGVDDLVKPIINSSVTTGYFQMTNVVDDVPSPPSGTNAKYPTNWNYTAYAKDTNTNALIPPNKLFDTLGASASTTVIRRVTDVLVNVGDDYFVKPIFATSGDNKTVTVFDGTDYLEKGSVEEKGIDLQVQTGSSLITNPELYWTTENIPYDKRNPKQASEAKKTGGLWLPSVFSPLYDYVPLSNGIKTENVTGATPSVSILANKLANSSGKFEFIFRVSNSSDMFIACLDTQSSVLPDWYTHIRPFSFNIQGRSFQRGGVTVLNNVINSDKRENAIIRYELSRPGRVTIQIYTLDGTLVKSLRRNEQRNAGEWTDSWDGSNNGGRAVARGMYFVRVVGPDIDEIRKIMVVK